MTAAESPDLRSKNSTWQRIAIGACVVFAVALLVRMGDYSQQPITDELYHLLAAESLVKEGTLAIADGVYQRAELFTRLVGITHALSDGDVDSIRMFGIVVGSLLVSIVFIWAVVHSGTVSAAISSAFLIFLPGAIFLAQHIRFYTLHAVIFLLIAFGAYHLVTTAMSLGRRIGIASGILILIAIGVHLQVTTLIGLMGIIGWAVLYHSRYLLQVIQKYWRQILLPAGVALAAGGAFIVIRDPISDLIRLYGSSALWNSGDSVLYYHDFYSAQLGAFWSLAPFAFVLALLAQPKPVFFCTCIFVASFVVQSFGGMRAERFLFYVMPFFFLVWGIALAEVFRMLRNRLVSTMTRLEWLGQRENMVHLTAFCIVSAAALFAFVSTPAIETGVRMAIGSSATDSSSQYWGRYKTDWQGASKELTDLARAADVTLVSQGLHALYYLGDYDQSISATALADVRSYGVEDAVDPRTGKVVFADADSMQQLIACHASGLVIIHEPAWRNGTRLPDAVANVIEQHLDQITLSKDYGLLVWEWHSPAGVPQCAS